MSYLRRQRPSKSHSATTGWRPAVKRMNNSMFYSQPAPLNPEYSPNRNTER